MRLVGICQSGSGYRFAETRMVSGTRSGVEAAGDVSLPFAPSKLSKRHCTTLLPTAKMPNATLGVHGWKGYQNEPSRANPSRCPIVVIHSLFAMFKTFDLSQLNTRGLFEKVEIQRRNLRLLAVCFYKSNSLLIYYAIQKNVFSFQGIRKSFFKKLEKMVDSDYK